MRFHFKFFACTLIVAACLWFAYWESNLSNKLSPKGPKQVIYKDRALFASDDDNADALNVHQNQFNSSLLNTRNESQSGLHVMILARMRTGSTLIGEIFNQNQDLFYLFEPLHTIDCYVRRGFMEEEERIFRSKYLLKNLNQCHFTESYLECIMAWGLGVYKSKVLYDMCAPRGKHCSGITVNEIAQECKTYNNRFAMKFIRADLEIIKPLVTEKGMNVKVIHLIRDPRGTANSRKKYYNDMLNSRRPQRLDRTVDRSMKALGLLDREPHVPYKVNTIESLCQWMRDTVGIATDRPEWLKGRYKMVRYEDMASDPLRIARDIYSFVGLDLPDNIVQWVKENTDVDNSDPSEKLLAARGGGVFSTHKNSTKTASSWRKYLGLDEVKEVQRICGDMMSLLGYPVIEQEKDLKNEDFHVTKPLKIGADITIT
ncbi:carbohydrate sulfotransferase 1-like [Amphiura filiformis]|uniref:carbohydrate sulfotransferase 1-like n=1 Tax=Amphiura filiformis TaxID=82378 RepID=UPI003B212B1B